KQMKNMNVNDLMSMSGMGAPPPGQETGDIPGGPGGLVRKKPVSAQQKSRDKAKKKAAKTARKKGRK
ncbi:hypothetical protein KKF84_22035, partial [Myxococcota bacterium]|nr:hypothetical protein [Myxococcota bacterium]